MLSIVTTCEGKREGVANAKDYSVMALRLAKSIRLNGGLFKDAPIYMWYAEDKAPSLEVQETLKGLGCILVAGKNVSDPLMSKVQAIADCSKFVPSTHILWMDSDMLVLKPMDQLVDFMGVDVAATSTEKIHHRYACPEDVPVLRALCRAHSISFEAYDKFKIMTMMDEQVGNFNFNSGIMLMRNQCSFAKLTFIEEYERISKSTYTKAKSDPDVTDYCFDATSIALAIVNSRLSWGKLPMTFNHYYALHQCVNPDTVIVHYQDNDLSALFPSLWNDL